jgi:Tol biopolymer transport system component
MSKQLESPPATAMSTTAGGGERPSRRALAAVTAFAIAVAGVGFAVVAFRSNDSARPAGTADTPTNGEIAFATGGAGHWQIFTVATDGTEATPLTDLPTNQFHPAWSPDGTKIAFDAQSGEGDMQIRVMDADGSNLQTLTEGSAWNYLPAWSPDGDRIAFVSNRYGNNEIYVMNTDGSGQERLTTDADEDLSPSWSPDGTQIAFQSNRDGFNQIYVMNADASGVTRPIDSEGFDPAWSADGARIAFASTADGNPEIYAMSADGSNVTRLTHDPSHDWNPIWSPDGSKIAFESDRDGEVGIFVMNSDGTDVRRLVDTGAQACCPAWQSGPAVEPSPSAPASEPTPFVPEPTIEGAAARVDVTWPDGSSATLVFPAELDLTSRGVQPDVSYTWADDPPADHPIVFVHGPPDAEFAYVEGEPEATLPLPEGGVATLWEASESQFTRHREIGWWLAYRTDSWTILASLHRESGAEILAGSLTASESETGFPSVGVSDPLALADGFGESEGPVLALGDSNPVPDVVSGLLDGTVFLSPDGCTGGPEFDPEHLDYYGSNCLAEGNVFASVYGDRAFIRDVLGGLQVGSLSVESGHLIGGAHTSDRNLAVPSLP